MESPKLHEVTVRSTVGPTQGYSLVVPVQVKGKSLESVVDTGAQVSIIDTSQFEVEPVVLRGLEPDKPINGHLIKDVSINFGERMGQQGKGKMWVECMLLGVL